MRRSPFVLLLLLVALLHPSAARSQYMYLDANGDGIHTAADVIATTGSTTVDVWLRTDQNRDGSPAECSTQDGPMNLFSYEFILRANGGTVAWSGFANRRPEFTSSLGEASSATDYRNGWSGGTLSPGLYQLASITITPTSGLPAIDVAASTTLNGTYITGFASNCTGPDLDNTPKLGSGWFDADGLLWGGPRPYPPVWAQPQDMTLLDHTTADQTIHATDIDGDPLTFSKSAGPAFMTVSTTDPGTGTATGNIHLAPPGRSPGNYVARVDASDGQFTVPATFAIHVQANRPPLVLPPVPPVVMYQGRDTSIVISGQSPDADRVSYTLSTGPNYAQVYDLNFHLEGVLVLSPRLRSSIGPAVAVVAAHDEVSADTESVSITVLPTEILPTVYVSGAYEAQIHMPTSIYVYAENYGYYPERDRITSLTVDVSGLPPGDGTSFTPHYGLDTAYGTLEWMPSQIGIFTLRFIATDEFGYTTVHVEDFEVHSRAVELTRPGDGRATPLVPFEFSVSASDPDGDPIQGLTAEFDETMTAGGATFTTNASNTVGTVRWTPRAQDCPPDGNGYYFVVFQATDGDLLTFDGVTITVNYTHLSRLDANALDMLVGTSGQTAFDPYRGRAGLIYPKGSNTSTLFALGPWIGGNEGGGLRMSRGGSQTEFFPGTMTGNGPTPYDGRFRNYRITRGDVTGEDYIHWPAGDGAPVDAGGHPLLEGDQMIWSVSNDAEPGRRVTGVEYAAGTPPVGVEIRQSTFAFAQATGPLANIAFVRFTMTNRSGAALDSAYATVWADPDVGGPADDLAGSDPSLDLGYVYNADDSDVMYGGTSPALGLAMLQAPVAPGSPDGGAPRASACTTYDISFVGTNRIPPAASFVLMQGRNTDGSVMHQGDDPSAPATTYRYSGDPVAGTGWLDTTPQDKRLMLSSGPFPFAAGETKEYVAAILVGQGSGRLASVAALRDLVPVARYVAASHYVLLPYVGAPAEVTVAEGATLTLPISALDLDGDPLTSVTADLIGLPIGNNANFVGGAAGGILTWTPSFVHAGTYVVRFTASNDKSGTFETSIRVLNTNRAPVAHAGGPYTGVAGYPVAFHGSTSSDPDGDPLSYAWTFGDGLTGVGAMIQHAYAAGGSYAIELTVRDPELLAGVDSTVAVIGAAVQARAFAIGLERLIRLASWWPFHCFQLEPVGNSFQISDVDARSIRLVSAGTGSITELPAFGAKALRYDDRDHNSISELTVCFSTHGLRQLFDRLPPGRQTVVAAMTGALVTGERFQAPITFEVIVPFALLASVAPNPMNPEATLTFRTTRSGPIRVRLLDVQGRLVRTLQDGPMEAGYHDLRISSTDDNGRKLASGIYFFAIEAPEGSERGKVIVLK